MKSIQGDRCAICYTKFSKDAHRKESPTIDHSHSTGIIRGILCNSCNWMLGHARDREDILQAAINYLLKTNQNQ